jgi:hypothetical protein
MTKNTKMIVGAVAVGAIVYYAYMQNKKGKTFFGKQKSFSGFSGDDNFFNITAKPRAQYIAGGYDAGHQNSDGSRGATWISYGGVGSAGFWQQGYVPQGQVVNP